MARHLTMGWIAASVLLMAACGGDAVHGADQDAEMKAGIEALYTARDFDTATGHFRRVLDANPEHYGATYQLATALDRAGRPDEAEPLWTKVATMAEGYDDEETLTTANNRLSGVREQPPEVALMELGMTLLYSRGANEEAIGVFRRVLEINPEHYGATYQLGAALHRAGRIDEALPVLEKSLSMARAIDDQHTESLILGYTGAAQD